MPEIESEGHPCASLPYHKVSSYSRILLQMKEGVVTKMRE